MRPNRIKVRILLPLTLVLAALFGAFVAGAYQHGQRKIDDAVERDLTAVQDLLNTELEEETGLMSAVLDVLARDGEFRGPRRMAAST